MATSKTPKSNAQYVVECKFCENFYVEFYCRNCGDEMCENCHDSHIKHPTFSGHITVPYHLRHIAGIPCRDHPNQFYDQGCKTCSIPICSECKIRSHLSHTPTDLNTVCDLAKRVIQEGLKQMQIRKREIDTSINYNRGLVFNHIQDFTQAKVNLKSRAKELKSCIDGILSTSIEEVENQEMLHRRSFKECFGELKRQSEKLGEKIRSCEISLDTLDPISLTFYRKNTAWNGIFRPFTSKTKIPKITRIMPKALDQYNMECLFGALCFEEEILGQKEEISPANRPHTAVPKPVAVPRPLVEEGQFPHRHIPKTRRERDERKRPISASFRSPENLKRYGMGLLEIPSQLGEFKSCSNFLFHIVYSEQLSCVYVSGDKSNVYAYWNVLEVKNPSSKLKIIDVSHEPNGLAIGFNNCLVYSVGYYGVFEIGRNINSDPKRVVSETVQSTGRLIFNKEGYTVHGVFYTMSGEYLICMIPYNNNNRAAVVKVDVHKKVKRECMFICNSKKEPLFSRPTFVCENRVNQNICVSDYDMKVIVLTSRGDFVFNYTGQQPVIKRTPFSPRGIACDGRGNILVADVGNDLVHMLRSNGEFITYILSSISPVSRPWGICVDSENRIWLVEENTDSEYVKSFTKFKVFQIYKTIARS